MASRANSLLNLCKSRKWEKRVLATMPKSASQTYPRSGFINDIEHILFNAARAGDIKNIEVAEFDQFENTLENTIGSIGRPGLEFGLEFLKDEFYCDGLMSELALG